MTSKKNILFCSTANLGKPYAGDSTYSRQILESLKKIPFLTTHFFYLGNSTFRSIKGIIIFPLLPIFYRHSIGIQHIWQTFVLVHRLKPNLVIIDHMRTSWIILIMRIFYRKTAIWFISHNYEAGIFQTSTEQSSFIIKLLHSFEYCKTSIFEQLICRLSDKVSFITEEDKLAAYHQFKLSPEKLFNLPPSAEFSIPVHQRRAKYDAIIIGSFHWRLKRQNLESFLNAKPDSMPPLKLLIAGSCPSDMVALLKEKYPFIDIINEFKSLESLSGIAQCAVCPDKAGGGFKLKSLDYLSLGLHIIALKGQLNGIDPNYCSVELVDSYKDIWNSIAQAKNIDIALVQKQNTLYVKSTFSNNNMIKRIDNIMEDLEINTL